MKLTKKQRELLKSKYGGRCAYCGQVLGEKWHADHIEPVVRDWWKPGMPTNYPERNTIENMNPSCAPCNIDKHSLDIETWRSIIERSNEVLERDIATFRRALRYRLIELKLKPVVFYFEEYLRDNNTETSESRQ